LEQHLLHKGLHAYRLDGDNIRFGLNKVSRNVSGVVRDVDLELIVSGSRVRPSKPGGERESIAFLSMFHHLHLCPPSFAPLLFILSCLKANLSCRGKVAEPSQIRRIGEVSLLFSLSCSITITAFISPYISDRDLARSLHEKHNPQVPFIEVYVDAPLDVVEKRDPKGLYKKARAGEIKGGFEFRARVRDPSSLALGGLKTSMLTVPDFTGISAPYEPPTKPEIHIHTDEVDVKGAVAIIFEYLKKQGLISA
jgi:adenylylsulfate kinase-like enzyme